MQNFEGYNTSTNLTTKNIGLKMYVNNKDKPTPKKA